MSSIEKTFHDPLIEEVRATRQLLVEEHGGLDGWIDHLQTEQNKLEKKPVDLPSDKNKSIH